MRTKLNLALNLFAHFVLLYVFFLLFCSIILAIAIAIIIARCSFTFFLPQRNFFLYFFYSFFTSFTHSYFSFMSTVHRFSSLIHRRCVDCVAAWEWSYELETSDKTSGRKEGKITKMHEIDRRTNVDCTVRRVSGACYSCKHNGCRHTTNRNARARRSLSIS